MKVSQKNELRNLRNQTFQKVLTSYHLLSGRISSAKYNFSSILCYFLELDRFMTCDFELGKFTYLDQIEPIPSPRKRSGVIEMPSPPILDLTCDDIEEVGPIFEVTKQPDLLSESVKRKLNGLSNGLESPSKKVAISQFVYFDDTDYGTDKKNNDLFKVDVVNKQYDTTKYDQPSSTITTPIPTPTQSRSPSPIPITVNSAKTTTKTKTPPPTPPTPTTAGNTCLWYMCETGTNFSTAELLYDHILSEHVEPCEGQEIFMCQWQRCKVYNVPSSSYNGFRGHALAHTKAKMYRCLITDCPTSFRTREGEYTCQLSRFGSKVSEK